MSTVLVVAPHPDDETLGCGGAILRHVKKGNKVHWLIITHALERYGFSSDWINQRDREIQRVGEEYGVSGITNLKFPTTRLDEQPIVELVESIGEVFQDLSPETVYVPYRNDIHTDHEVVFDAVAACTKWFRYPYIRRIFAYETLSETEFAIDPNTDGFQPNVFVDITEYLEKKIEIMRIYESEIGDHPFPRSESAMRALATSRGAASGFEAAEAFMLLKERVS